MKREIAILRRLGPIPFWRGSVRCLAELGKIYERAGAVARSELMGCDADGAAKAAVEKGGVSVRPSRQSRTA